MNPKWKKRAYDFWTEWAKPVLIVLIVVVSFRSALADWNDVPTGSMLPTILEGDRIFVNKMAYGLRIPLTSMRVWQWDGPQRGDIVVCFSPHDGTRLVKRVVGIPGDTIEYRNQHLFINGESMNYAEPEPDAVPKHHLGQRAQNNFSSEELGQHNHLIMTYPEPRSGRSFGPTSILKKDQYFMMGDNRDNSFDSRYFGYVERSRIIGKATGIVMSLDPEIYYAPRWDRFFNKLN